MQRLNSWDVRAYMSNISTYFHIYKKKSQIVPEEIIVNDTCPICMNTYKNSHVLCGECGHCFHKTCFTSSILYSKDLTHDEKLSFFYDSVNKHNLNVLMLKKKNSIKCPVCREYFRMKTMFKVKV